MEEIRREKNCTVDKFIRKRQTALRPQYTPRKKLTTSFDHAKT